MNVARTKIIRKIATDLAFASRMRQYRNSYERFVYDFLGFHVPSYARRLMLKGIILTTANSDISLNHCGIEQSGSSLAS